MKRVKFVLSPKIFQEGLDGEGIPSPQPKIVQIDSGKDFVPKSTRGGKATPWIKYLCSDIRPIVEQGIEANGNPSFGPVHSAVWIATT